MTSSFRLFFIGFIFCAGVLLGGGSARAQNSIFTYQGKLIDGSAAANGNYTMRFELFSAASGGTQIGATISNPNVNVSGGVFTVNLDFGAAAFTSANRFLQVSVFSTATNAFVDLTPRQALTSAPYAVRSANAANADNAANAANATNAANLGGVPASGFVQTSDPRLSDSRSPTAGSGNYIQNQIAGTQPSSGFKISGNGTVGGTLSGNAVNSATQYNLNNSRLILADYANQNTFVGFEANGSNANTGSNNSFFGKYAGNANTTGFDNSFFGLLAGEANLTGGNNSFFGKRAGDSNTSGGVNSFFGSEAGGSSTSGDFNSFFGYTAGFANTTGDHNTALGANANFSAANLNYATAVGAGATVSTSNTVVLDRTADDVRVPGNLVVSTLGTAGSTSLCRNALNQISTCTAGNFAEKSDSILLDALREQNALLQRESKRREMLIGDLRAVVCELKPQAVVCKGVTR